MNTEIKETLGLMTQEERIALFMDIYNSELIDQAELRKLAGLDEEYYQEKMKAASEYFEETRFWDLDTDILMQEYNRMLKEERES